MVRIYLPPDANTLLSVADHCLRSRHYINLIVAGKSPQWLTMDEAVAHCTTGLGIWKWASNDNGNPDVVIASCGDVPTMALDLLGIPLPRLVDLWREPRHARIASSVSWKRSMLFSTHMSNGVVVVPSSLYPRTCRLS